MMIWIKTTGMQIFTVPLLTTRTFLLQAKPYPTIRASKLKRDDNSKSNHKNGCGLTPRLQKTLAKLDKMKVLKNRGDSVSQKRSFQSSQQSNKTSAPSWVQDLAKSELSYVSNGNLRENRRLYSSQPKIGTTPRRCWST